MKKLIIAIALLSVSACVSSKKYDALEANYQKEKIDAESNATQTELLRQQNDQLQVELSKLRRENNTLRRNIAYNTPENANVTSSEWEKRYRQLEQSYQELMRNSAQEAKNYQAQLQQKEMEVSQLRGNPRPNQTQVTINNQLPNNPGTNPNYTPGTNPDNSNLNNTIPNNLPSNQKAAINNPEAILNLQSRLQQALAAFDNEEAQVTAQNNQLMVRLRDSRLYQTNLKGEYQLSNRGKQILSTVANFTLSQPNTMLLVEGQGQPADGNNTRYLKSKAFAGFMNTTGANYRFREKNNVPMAFNTSGTESRPAETIIFFSQVSP